MKSSSRIFVCVFALFLSACSATGPIYEDHPVNTKEALIHVYRPSAMVNSGGSPALYVNGLKYPLLKNAGYRVAYIPPGTAEIVLKDGKLWGLKPIGLRTKVEAGKKYYFRFGNEITSFVVLPGTGFYSSRIVIQEVPEEFALKEIVETHRSDDD